MTYHTSMSYKQLILINSQIRDFEDHEMYYGVNDQILLTMVGFGQVTAYIDDPRKNKVLIYPTILVEISREIKNALCTI
jgi:hypothetical protein